MKATGTVHHHLRSVTAADAHKSIPQHSTQELLPKHVTTESSIGTNRGTESSMASIAKQTEEHRQSNDTSLLLLLL